MRIPGLGPLFLKMALSRFAYIFVLLNQSGIPILQTLEITSSTIDNRVLSRSLEVIGQRVKEGKSLAEAMKESGRFTLLVLQMVAVGESSGSLDQMLMRVTEYYDLEVENTIKKLSTYIEPALTLVMGITVLFLALAVFLPWWNLASLFR
jgi:type II secretory pathway component PulF